jgi:beta-1,4-mannosyl-glycoprotein beta-1,4-N-acetylglucosaminyltransferase
MAIYDYTCFFNENDTLEIRINQHWDFVDKFIVVEAGETHTGLKKPYNFDHERFKPYMDKLVYVTFDSFDQAVKDNPQLLDNNTFHNRGGNKDSLDWGRDNFQFNYSHKVMKDIGAKDDDIIIITCCDEILRKATVDKCVETINNDPNNDHVFMFQLQLYTFKYNMLTCSWEKTDTTGQLMTYKSMKTGLIATRREHRVCTDVIGNAGWHFCSMDKYSDGSMIQQKYQAWAHSRDSSPGQKSRFELTKEEALARLLQDYTFEKVVEVNSDNHPVYLVNNQDKYSDYILPVSEFNE